MPGDELALNLNNLTNLTSLRLSGISPQDDDLRFLTGLSHLQDLSLSAISLPESTLECLENMSELKLLDLTGISRATKEDFSHMAGLTKLRDVTLQGKISDAALKDLPCLPSVWSLWIYSEERIRPETRVLLQERLPAIQYIHYRQLSPNIFQTAPNRSGR
jgi:hypothetical protein